MVDDSTSTCEDGKENIELDFTGCDNHGFFDAVTETSSVVTESGNLSHFEQFLSPVHYEACDVTFPPDVSSMQSANVLPKY
jgi:hypothetical protein